MRKIKKLFAEWNTILWTAYMATAFCLPIILLISSQDGRNKNNQEVNLSWKGD